MVGYYCLFIALAMHQYVQSRHVFPDGHVQNNLPWLLDKELPPRLKHANENVCHSDSCRISAQKLRQSIDPLINPCEDFYSFACGGWIKHHPVPPTENHWNQFDILDEKLDLQVHQMLEEDMSENEIDVVKAAKLTYHACMDEDRIEKRGLRPLAELLNSLGGWPIASSAWDSTKFHWSEMVAYSTSKLAINPILFVYVDVDHKNTKRNIITIDQPSLTLPRYMLVDPQLDYIEPYITFITEAATLLAREEKNVFQFGIYIQAYQIMKFERDLAKITKKEEDRRDVNKLYNFLTIGELQNWTDNIPVFNHNSRIDWKEFLSSIGRQGLEVEDGTGIVVTDFEFIHKLIKLIDGTSPRTLANYILWRVVKTTSRDLNKEMVQLNFRYKSQLSGVTEDHPRWRECVLNAGYLTFVLGYMYVNKHFSDEAKTKAVSMVENIRAAFRQELAEVSWMDDKTKQAALEKADFMNYFIGYPDWFSNTSFLEEYYRGVKIGKDHFQNKITLRGFLANKVLSRLETATNRSEWTTSPAIVNAYYNPQLNSIIFPAGILQHPFFSKDQPEALNYGSIGAVMGHEVTHGFDDTGRQSDKEGNIAQWWSKGTEETYLKNAQCFIDQYQNYRVPELDVLLSTKVTMNGVVTLGENIADNGGLRAALRAYKTFIENSGVRDPKLPGLEHYTPEQLFYLGFANVWCESSTQESLLGEVLGDAHSPHRLRVTGTLSNMPHFARTWKCPRGSGMNPDQKCQLW